MNSPDRKSILCVEDDETCEMFAALYPEYQFVFATTVAEARQLAASRQFDLFMLDVRLPDGNGIELCREMKALSPQTPVVLCSGYARDVDIRIGLMAGADAYQIKPLNFDLLREVLQSLTSSSGQQPVRNH
ncbi:MAG TPA: response regulator [Blastocatellia bacterium]|nr:response regulator [Blastocatellia bacterium]